jgi:putative ABC transport system substrate-binding protein
LVRLKVDVIFVTPTPAAMAARNATRTIPIVMRGVGARRVAILSNPDNPAHALAVDTLESTARSLALQLQLLQARGPDAFDAAFGAMTKERAGALFVVADSMFFSTKHASPISP